MSNLTLIAAAWLGVVVHVAVGIVAWWRLSTLPLLPLLNLATAVCVLAYWAQKWFGYVSQGITWYASDQLLPLYAIMVCMLSGLTIAGRYSGSLPHWLVFGFDALVLVAAALFFSFFRMSRLI